MIERMYVCLRLGLAAGFILAGVACRASDVQERQVATDLVPSPVAYSVLLPPDYTDSSEQYPLLLFLHGGNGDQGFLNQFEAVFKEAWAAGDCPEMIVVTPSCGRSFYMDYKDGSQQWETFIVDGLIPEVRNAYRVAAGRENTFISGISMGGMGSLRIAFKHPDQFGAVVSFEPGIEPAFAWKDVELRDKFWRSQPLLETIYGKPFDEAYWAANNPATIARDHPETLKAANLGIYLDAGTADSFGLDRGTDFLHRVLYDNGIAHEYRLVYGADHVGRSLLFRVHDGLWFLGRWLDPPDQGPQVPTLHVLIRRLKRQAGLED